MRKTCEGSLTVEGAMVMGITLILIGSLLLGIFGIEERVAGNMLLAEALERTICAEDGLSAELGITPGKIEEGCARKLRSIFRCGDSRLSVDAGGIFRIQGTCAGRVTTEMSVRKNDPEQFLRILTAIRGEDTAGGSGQDAAGDGGNAVPAEKGDGP